MFIDSICRFYFSCCLLIFAVFSDPLYLHLGVVVIIKSELGMWRRRGRAGALCPCTFTVVILPVRKDGVPEERIEFSGRDMIHLSSKHYPHHSAFI